MVRNELIKKIKEETLHYIGIPYWKNTLKNGVVVKNGIFGGKGTCEQIAAKTIELAQKQKIDLLKLTPQKIYNFQKKNKLGIDCSGLTSNLLNLILKLNKIEFQINPFKTSAKALTSPEFSQKIKDYDQIKTGDIIRTDSGKHVIFIIEKIGNIISYVQSSQKTFTRGVHYGHIEIVNPKKSLKYQLWSDKTKDGKKYSTLFNSKNGDGIYRLNALEK